ncbi:MAG: indole-3-glycerol phosphate synthase TrpC [Vicinamibacterales bacterium]|nr:indole-3-glycerol phosphate synthase TrpC [Vicinamibacterales bacterium]
MDVREDAAAAMVPDLLATIVAAARHSVEERVRRCPASELARQASAMRPGGDRFLASLRSTDGPRVIAECKRRSPSKGVLRTDYHPERIAAGYEAHGAAAISVLTEPTFFDGSLDHLRRVRTAVDVPLLRKDFIVTPYQLLEAVAAGADAVLLIVAALDDDALQRLLTEATALGLAVLVEVHSQAELSRAVALGARIIGVNNRNLRTLTVDLNASRELIGQMPDPIVGIAESGLRTSDDLVGLGRAGYRAFLIGETLMSTPDPGETLGRLIADTRAATAADDAPGRANGDAT